jgi:fibronectin type 3 domain-containing protein
VKDIFPPAQPAGVQAVFSSIGQKPFIDLTWTPNTETDLAGYEVFRREGNSEAVKITAQPVKAPSFRDENVKLGTKYFYSVLAIDLRGNRSPLSAETSEQVPKDLR